ncbi:MAG: VWA domain-containing protein [Legionella sp.]|nr:VWA domain-containing protein [Legionella sp.]
MIDYFHFLRPWWFLCLIPLLFLITRLWRQNLHLHAWSAICDSHLLAPLIQNRSTTKRQSALVLFFISSLFMIISLAGPVWSRLPVPAYHQIQPRVLVLDMSDSMLVQDLTPDRLTRAKFKLHDLLSQKEGGQFGLVVYTGEPFVVSPLTDDSNTITSLFQTLTPDIMPVDGSQLDKALDQAAKLITQAGYTHGQLLVLTGTPPDSAAINAAKKFAGMRIFTSVMPIIADETLNKLFQPLAKAGGGALLPVSNTSQDLLNWLKISTNNQQFVRSQQDDMPLWRDEGRWFLWPALILLLPAFWRGWLQRVDS